VGKNNGMAVDDEVYPRYVTEVDAMSEVNLGHPRGIRTAGNVPLRVVALDLQFSKLY
jgi:hypothetical protein